jgi:hypothetical protein
MPSSRFRNPLALLAFCALAVRPPVAAAQEPHPAGPSVAAQAADRAPSPIGTPGAAAREPAPVAVLLSNGQRWERVTLRHVDVRTLAPLFGAIVLPTEEQWFLARWFGGALDASMGGPGGFLAAPPAAGFLEGAPQPVAGPGFNGPGRLLILADPITNALIVDP